jgi:hypothetical protein
MTVAELGVRMSARELGEWQALYRVEAAEREREEERAERRMKAR